VTVVAERHADGQRDQTERWQVSRLANELAVRARDREHRVRRASPPDASAGPARDRAHGAALVEAPLPGRVVRIAVAVGDAVTERQPLVVVEAMKIETAIAAPRDGVVAAVLCEVGQAVAGGQVLVELASR
jgi:biotin carboxyl carrier protein